MKKVVIVDDNKMFVESVPWLLEKVYKCITFTNPIDALRYIIENDDVYGLVTDYEMPQMTGFELIKEVLDKANVEKLVLMSGHDRRYLQKKANEAGADSSVILLCKSHLINLLALLNA